jgi:nitrogen fixation/metabolism regulation signal transduction histidine kinase
VKYLRYLVDYKMLFKGLNITLYIVILFSIVLLVIIMSIAMCLMLVSQWVEPAP